MRSPCCCIWFGDDDYLKQEEGRGGRFLRTDPRCVAYGEVR